jgi:hypothetical protein
MANEAKAEKKTRSKNTKKAEWIGKDGKKYDGVKNSGNVASRKVDSVYGPDKKAITYTEKKLHGISDPSKALELLGLKSSRAVAAINYGFNMLARKAAGNNTSLAQKIAETKGISLEEALKLLA